MQGDKGEEMKVTICGICGSTDIIQGSVSGRWYCKACTELPLLKTGIASTRLIEVTPLVTPQEER